ncbi:MAG: hypothetical protein KC414_14715, partial [Romboutsia sp.]|nr:hypothetical protein [Romboutsia sp.]
NKIPLGVIYKEEKMTYEDHLPQIKEKPLVEHSLVRENMGELLSQYI